MEISTTLVSDCATPSNRQVSGRSDLDYPDRVDFELTYKSKRSFFFDLKILLKTFLVVINRKGAH